MSATLAAPTVDAEAMDAVGGWTIHLTCPCGRTGAYNAVVPSLAGDAAERDGWAVDRDVLAAQGEHVALCPPCTLESTLRSAG